MGNKRKVHVTSYFVCTKCGMELPLMRIHGELREKNHIKDIYCPVCKDTEKFQEIGHNGFYKSMDGTILCDIIDPEKEREEN